MRYVTILIMCFFIACNQDKKQDQDPDIVPPPTGIAPPQTISYAIINQYQHDTSAYTQGLELYNGKLYEGTGDYEQSSLRIVDIKTGKVEKIHNMGSAEIFGEGITILNKKLYQLTWQNKLVNLYDVENIEKPLKTFSWPNEGWGITHNDSLLIVSDGTSNLYFVDPATFKVLSAVSVKDNNGAVNMLNELEYVDGFVYANVYETNFIVKINPESGHVVGRIDLSGLLQPQDVVPYRTNVLNGIAYDKQNNSFYITGKRWPKLFEMKLN